MWSVSSFFSDIKIEMHKQLSSVLYGLMVKTKLYLNDVNYSIHSPIAIATWQLEKGRRFQGGG